MSLVLRSSLLSAAGVKHGFSLRTGGVSQGAFASLNLARNVGDDPEHVAENQRRFAEDVGCAPEAIFTVSQVHGDVVRVVDGDSNAQAIRGLEGDALIAIAATRAVGVRVADCVALLLADPTAGVVAAVHAGWRGVASEIVARAVEAMCANASRSVQRERIVVAMFPHIRACCFEVGEEVVAALARFGGEGAVDRSRAKPHVDLTHVLRAQLRGVGIAPMRVDDVAGCTHCDASRFYSYRRDGKAAGRHMAVIMAPSL